MNVNFHAFAGVTLVSQTYLLFNEFDGPNFTQKWAEDPVKDRSGSWGSKRRLLRVRARSDEAAEAAAGQGQHQ